MNRSTSRRKKTQALSRTLASKNRRAVKSVHPRHKPNIHDKASAASVPTTFAARPTSVSVVPISPYQVVVCLPDSLWQYRCSQVLQDCSKSTISCVLSSSIIEVTPHHRPGRPADPNRACALRVAVSQSSIACPVHPRLCTCPRARNTLGRAKMSSLL